VFTPESVSGDYNHMKAEFNAGRTILCVFHVDDHFGYTDLFLMDDTAGTGHKSTGYDASTVPGDTGY